MKYAKSVDDETANKFTYEDVMNGYLEMAEINLELADKCFHAENEAQELNEKYIDN